MAKIINKFFAKIVLFLMALGVFVSNGLIIPVEGLTDGTQKTVERQSQLAEVKILPAALEGDEQEWRYCRKCDEYYMPENTHTCR